MERKINKPLFSIVIPTYNHASFINRCLDSVVAQTYSNWEAIVVNNYSEDNTIELVNGYNNYRIRLINFRNNGIIAASRNTGIREAKGEWICFLDSDDWWAPTKLQTCFEHINDHLDLVYHSLKIIGEAPILFRRKTIKSWQVKTPVIIDLLVNGNPITNSSVVVRKSLLYQIGGIDENVEMVACEDYNTWLRIAQITDAFFYIPQTLGAYMVHEASISQKDMSIPSRNACVEFMHLLNDQQKFKLESNLRFTKGQFAFISGDYSAAKKDFLFCSRHGNLFIKLKSIFMLIASQKILR
jgi:glycosyltransferase involved in cell wall biosynthesis